MYYFGCLKLRAWRDGEKGKEISLIFNSHYKLFKICGTILVSQNIHDFNYTQINFHKNSFQLYVVIGEI